MLGKGVPTADSASNHKLFVTALAQSCKGRFEMEVSLSLALRCQHTTSSDCAHLTIRQCISLVDNLLGEFRANTDTDRLGGMT